MQLRLLFISVLLSASAAAQPVANAGIDQTFELPRSIAVIYGGSPFSQKSSVSAISSFSWTQIGGPATAVMSRFFDTYQAINNTDSTVFLSGLTVAGTYQFRLQVTDANGTAADTVNIIVLPVPALNPSPKRITINGSVYYPTNAGSELNIQPGDTIALNGATLNSTHEIILGNFKGTWAQPIYIIPINADVFVNKLSLGVSAYQVGDCRVSHVIIDGRRNGVSGAIRSREFAAWSVSYYELRYCRGDGSIPGNALIHLAGYHNGPTDYRLMFPAMFRIGFLIHDNYVINSSEESVYGGPTSLTNEGWSSVRYHPRGTDLYIYNNIFINSGRDGIQMGGFYKAYCFNNSIYNTGVNQVYGQRSGINAGTFCKAKVYNNYIWKTGGPAGYINGYDTVIYENNYIDSAGGQEIGLGSAVFYVGAANHNPEKVIPKRAIVKKNYVRAVYPAILTGRSENSGNDSPSQFDSNFIWRPNGGSDWYYVDDPLATTRGNVSVNNIVWPSFPLSRVDGPAFDSWFPLPGGGGSVPANTFPGTRMTNKSKQKFRSQ